MAIFKSSFRAKLIYVFRINDEAHRNCLKIGEATMSEGQDSLNVQPCCKALNAAAKKRIDEYTRTAGISYELLYTESAVFLRNNQIMSINDKEVHNILLRSGIQRKFFDTEHKANEWFSTDLETTKRAICAAKQRRQALTTAEISTENSPIIFRPEQSDAIKKTIKKFKKGNQFLWNAKMRFGKTLSALQVVKEEAFKRTLIITHRPVVDVGWFEDFGKIFYDRPQYVYGSKNNGESFYSLEQLADLHDKHYVYFASMQDLRGSVLVGGKFDKNERVFSTHWDMLIIDEAHEGTQTFLGDAVIKELIKDTTKVLYLSGTPFNLLDKYEEDEIYTWDYVMEQRAKANWDLIHAGDPNPYAGLPKMNIYTYDLNKLLDKYEDSDSAFNFTEFFRANEAGEFTHYKDVLSFLNLLCKTDNESNYPFSTEAYRDNFRHTLWVVPGVKAAKALSAMLQAHPVFCNFDIVNVAGNGDSDEENADALEMVNMAIGDHPEQTCTITLTCGRLTTGVSVKAWTAVFMLSGSYSTKAQTYMQTIFRVQTPATIAGKVKEECYVFDFAPDRTLKVIAETAKISAKAGKTSGSDRETMGEFLNFCPIIGYEGSRMCSYDVPRMLEQLKKVYVERVVRNGFEDGYLYNDDLMRLDEMQLKEFDDLKKIIGATKAMPKSDEIDINKQGFTEEEYERVQQATDKAHKNKPLTDEEQRLLQELDKKRKNRDAAISILRGISIRMPLMIYGATIKDDEEVTIDNFASLIDQQSWEEFMPKNVTQEKFNSFKRYYDPEVFSAACRRIRAMARAADSLDIEERIERITAIFATFRNPDKETVLTPWRVVNMHIGDSLGGYVFFDEDMQQPLFTPRFVNHGNVTSEVFAGNTRILEINSKSGLYPLYMAYSVYRNRLNEKLDLMDTQENSIERHLRVWDKVLADNIFVICKTPMAKSITQRTLAGFRNAHINAHCFDDLINQIKNKTDNFIVRVSKGSYWKKDTNTMKFTAIVGNPPYQIVKSDTSDEPIYNQFYDIAFKLSDKVTFITPARFLFNAGKTPKDWNDKMLHDSHFKVVWYKAKSTDVFPNVDIKGGVAVGFRDAKSDFGSIGLYSAHQALSTIWNKVNNGNFSSISNIIFAQDKFNLENVFADYPGIASKIGSNGRERRLTTPIFGLTELFKDIETNEDDVEIIGLVKNQRAKRFICSKYIDSNGNIGYWKVIIPKSNGSGAIGEVLSTPLIGEPLIGVTQSFIVLGHFDSQNEAIAAHKYVLSKFCRTMLGILKVTQDNSRDVWKCVPLQDFTDKSDIDWSQSVADIDRQLYAKYHLDDSEIAFIESMIKPME